MKRKRFDGRQAVMQDFAKAAADRGEHFFYIRIPEALGPVARGEKYEDPLAGAIGKLGEVTGGGSQLGEGNSIAYCGIDIVVSDRALGLEVIRRTMRACGAPTDTVIEEYLPEYKELRL
ncbi:MAG: hypothetical protein WCB94_00645 [Terriglobales bacterium]